LYIPRIGRYALDMKDFYHTGTFHGTANYQLERPEKKSEPEDTGIKTKMRSYEQKKGKQRALVLDNGELAISDRYDKHSPAEVFLHSLRTPGKTERPDLFARTNILKTKEYVHKIDKFDQSDLVPGDNIVQLRSIKEFSLAQFTYLSVKQFKAIQRQHERLRSRYGQSYERHFLNEDGTLRYKEMIETIDRLIQNGVMNIERELDESRHRNRDLKNAGLSVNSPSYDTWKKARAFVDKAMISEEEITGRDDGEFFEDEMWEE
jgi:hypothetical protein